MPPLDSAAVVAAVRDYVARAIAPLQHRIDNLAVILKDISDRPSPKDGEPGRPGDPGPPGLQGDPGASVGVEDIRPLVAEEVSKTVAELPKPKDGIDGKDGKDGIFGKDGKDGASVGIEDLRPLVVEEISNTIALVPKAKDGAPGRDAAQIEVAAAIDEAKSYPRGTYAKHANGLWRAYETTEGMRGWECLVAGVAGIEVLCNHEREFQVVHTLSDGKQFAQSFELPLLIYRGVFAEGREYHRGDQVSWGAHQWHCNEPTTEKPIEGGKAWTLAVKRGRDGKQGDPGKDGKTIVVKEKA